MSSKINESLRDECQVTLETLQKLNQPETKELQSKLAWCIGSFDFDKNPVGLYEFGIVALETMRNIKKNNPRKINKKVIEGLEVGLHNYESSSN